MVDKTTARGEIFVVDDDPAVRDTLSMVLSAAGYQVICFADGAALLAVARSRTPAAILLDVHIPGKSGLDILRELHGEDYPAPIFMISGQGDIAMAVSAIKNGALDFIEKPFAETVIIEAIQRAAERLSDLQTETDNVADIRARLDTLSDRERQVLAFERQWWRYAGAKEQAIRNMFGVSSTRYYQLLNALLDNPAALAYDPVLVQRLRRLRATRTRSRATGRSA